MSRANSQNPNLDVQVEAFIRSLAAKGGRPLHEIGYDAARKVLRDVQDICVEKGTSKTLTFRWRTAVQPEYA